jgi:thioredoxin 1
MSEKITTVTESTWEKEVLQSPMPVLVDFWAEWCAPCRMLAPTVDAVARDYDGKLRVAKLNVDENPNTPNRYGVRGIPTLLLFKGGQVADQLVGNLPREHIERMLQKHLS